LCCGLDRTARALGLESATFVDSSSIFVLRSGLPVAARPSFDQIPCGLGIAISSIWNWISRNAAWLCNAKETFQDTYEENMNTRILKQAFVVAMAVMGSLTIGSTMVFGQDKADKQSDDSPGNTLEGVWQPVLTQRNCNTGVPAPTSFKGLSTFMQGGTMSEDGLDPASPYRTPGQGIWERTSGRQYIAAWTYFTFSPTGAFTGTVKIEEVKTLSQDFNSLTGDAVVTVLIPNGTLVVYGCSSEIGTRFTF
jgi:hypothetical protein